MDSPPPSPTHILRSHSTPLTTLSISNDNERIYSADSSGLVVVTSTRSLRALASWRAHDDGVLGVQECGGRVITHGRDNKLHIWTRTDIDDHASHIGGSASVPGLPTPTLYHSMDVNALNYCRFSLMPTDESSNHDEALICIPNLVESSLADIWSLPDCQRIHAAIGKSDTRASDSDGRTVSSPTGIIMSMHLFTSPQTQTHTQTQPHTQNHKELRLLCAYENGGVILRKFNPTPVPTTSTSTSTSETTPGKTPGKTQTKTPTKTKTTSVEGIGWDVIWSVKVHVESIMAMSVSKDNTLALTVSADHLIGRYDLTNTSPSPPTHTPHSHRTKHPGNGSIAIRDDGRVCAVGGWDGRIRLYSTRTMKPLGTLRYHKSGCQGVVFARSLSLPLSLSSTFTVPSTFDASVREDGDGDEDEERGKDKHEKEDRKGEEEDEDEEMSTEEKAERSRWLISAGKDGRVAVWVLRDFEKGA